MPFLLCDVRRLSKVVQETLGQSWLLEEFHVSQEGACLSITATFSYGLVDSPFLWHKTKSVSCLRYL